MPLDADLESKLAFLMEQKGYIIQSVPLGRKNITHS